MSVSCILYKAVRWLTQSPKLLFHTAWEMTPFLGLSFVCSFIPALKSTLWFLWTIKAFLSSRTFSLVQLCILHIHRKYGDMAPTSIASPVASTHCQCTEPNLVAGTPVFTFPNSSEKESRKPDLWLLIYPAVLGFPLSLRMWLSSHSSYIFHTF